MSACPVPSAPPAGADTDPKSRTPHSENAAPADTASALPELERACRAWLQRVAQGDEQALTQIYDATSSRLYALALRITRSPSCAEDVLIEVYWQLWRQAQDYDPLRGSAMAWLMTICRSRALDLLRDRDRAELYAKSEDFADGGALDQASTEDLLLALERGSAVHAALQELSALQRQLLALAFFRGYTHQEIAQYMKLPIGSVKTHVRRALLCLRRKLRGKLADCDDERA